MYRSPITTEPPQSNHATTPAAPPTLAELAAMARRERQPKTAQLDSHREELLRLRREGDSVEVLATALRGLGVEISDEALRLWLNRELGHKPARRRKVRLRFSRNVSEPSPVGGAPAERTAVALPAAGIAAGSVRTEPLPKSLDSAPERPSALILPGETPLQAFRRRLAALGAAQAKGGGAN